MCLHFRVKKFLGFVGQAICQRFGAGKKINVFSLLSEKVSQFSLGIQFVDDFPREKNNAISPSSELSSQFVLN